MKKPLWRFQIDGYGLRLLTPLFGLEVACGAFDYVTNSIWCGFRTAYRRNKNWKPYQLLFLKGWEWRLRRWDAWFVRHHGFPLDSYTNSFRTVINNADR